MSLDSSQLVSNTVRTAIKREGKFDAIRNKELAVLTADPLVVDLKTNVEKVVEDIVRNMPSNWTREQLRNKVKERLMTDQFQTPINEKVQNHIDSDLIKNELEKDIRRKVRANYDLPPESGEESDSKQQEEEVDIMTV